ncbi:MAG: alanine--glyoxylate aminotransferase [candidate division NC10 bacterium]|nr:alanine--glyoxylate aminotransferase [candidate division NC10 bacterium]
MTTSKSFQPPYRLLLGPGPSNVEDRVLRAMSAQVVGYFDPVMTEIAGEIGRLLRMAFGTANRATFPISGTGTSGMEAALVNLLDPGDKCVIGHNGFFGDRLVQIAERCGGVPVPIAGEWGRPIFAEQVEAAVKREGKVKAIAVVHAETSTGVLQPLEGLRQIADRYGAYLLVDAVTSLGGHPVEIDRHGVDVCYSGTQKALSAPTGLSPITLSDRCLDLLRKRPRKLQTYYLDLALFEQYWAGNPFYHHTPPTTFYYALLEALRIVEEEGLEARWARHRLNHRALVAGVEAMGLAMHVEPAYRLWTLNTVKIPEGVDDAKVRGRLLKEFGIEIGGGLGTLKGKVWRIGLMGVNSRPNNVLLLLAALERILPAEGCSCGSGIAAANAVYQG